ncbi:SIR2 family protein [Paenibacillus sp. MBLB4367]|uniref:SIR2 family protein n=1 Tax=Paenibacillus sp. MBLB4367 TaxID=3384767 RepID=UPI003907E91C
MSLEPLIAAAATKLGIEKEAALAKIHGLVELGGFSPFSKDALLAVFAESEINTLLHVIRETEGLESYFYYRCVSQAGEGQTYNLDEECEYCDWNIGEVDRHEIEELFVLKHSFIESIRSRVIQAEEDNYLKSDFPRNLEMLSSEIKDVIPFLGSGVSMALGLPSWKGLLEILEEGAFADQESNEVFKALIAEGDLLAAFDYLVDSSYEFASYDQIKERIVEIIKEWRKDERLDQHNYGDLVSLNSRFYITTNYDLLMSEFLSTENGKYTAPVCLREIESIRRLMKGENQVIHLHGHINKMDTMIVSNKDYEELYGDQKLLIKFSSIMNNNPLLFIGFSFTDKFFEDLYEKMISIVKSKHYILIPNADLETVRKFNIKNIKVVSLNVKRDSKGMLDSADYVKSIRILVRYLTKDY